MTEQEIINDNYEKKEGSFIYLLKTKEVFNKEAYRQLCNAIHNLGEKNVLISADATKINFIYGEILKAFLYHFNSADIYKIKEMPENYNRTITALDSAVKYYFNTRI